LSKRRKNGGGCVAVPAGLEQDVDHIAVLVDGAPEVLALPPDGHKEFVQMPGVAHGAMRWRSRRAVGKAEGLAPLPDGFVRDEDATLGEQVFDVTEAQSEAVVARPRD
jgi:hypothetical protein